ncbi:lysophospholipid acyltransferase family protein [Polycladidibacter hongkongensis]|uniref:lysophospholipid acyltransferase family protein n=1 Tax=Polycladidibacter hongkongensis TaxID=1647556 RepID=UPI0008301990|nr:lysophospholipid acyltransferase family protein [Pseudovibrio hongkongensis]
MATLRALTVILALTVITLVLIPPQWLAVKLNLPMQRNLPYFWHRIAHRLLGMRVIQHGKMAADRPLLVTANHASWLDIVTLGCTGPLSFIAKQEVSGWPIFGLFAKLQRTVFVNRQRRSETGKVANQIARRMASGDAMVLFAEGTSSNGNEVLPFRSALVGAVHQAMGAGKSDDEPAQVFVQPLSIAYTKLHGIPIGRFWRSHVAWYGDMELAGHLWNIIKEGGLDVELTWGLPIALNQSVNRKELTGRLEGQVREMTAAALAGTLVEPDGLEIAEFQK